MTDYIVTDHPFNRHWSPDLIGHVYRAGEPIRPYTLVREYRECVADVAHPCDCDICEGERARIREDIRLHHGDGDEPLYPGGETRDEYRRRICG